ncbi:hypothetical protein EST38_g14187 [Candolleomyces aberdarensis]|uniref:Uncharacterized protein n=1 Tax=Candolleomyces aberdarensis TaxID=2316362 RepID=A0A4V1Q1I1_9AGAR|nr:hypothetical protein EST38_g14187 [Candolleomyces aberdarensis]
MDEPTVDEPGGSAYLKVEWLTNIHSPKRTELTDTYDHIVENQDEEEYCYQVNIEGNWVCVEDEEGTAAVEATYKGWCGVYDGMYEQLEAGHM